MSRKAGREPRFGTRRSGPLGTARLGTRGAPCRRGSGMTVGVIGAQSFGLGDGQQAVVGTDEHQQRYQSRQ